MAVFQYYKLRQISSIIYSKVFLNIFFNALLAMKNNLFVLSRIFSSITFISSSYSDTQHDLCVTGKIAGREKVYVRSSVGELTKKIFPTGATSEERSSESTSPLDPQTQ